MIRKWTSNGETYVLEGILKAGKEYQLVEVEAPDEYQQLDDSIQIKVREDGELQKIVIENKKENIVPTKTGDDSQSTIYMILMGLSGLGIILLSFFQKRESL